MITGISFVPVWALHQETAEQLRTLKALRSLKALRTLMALRSLMTQGAWTRGAGSGNWYSFTGRST